MKFEFLSRLTTKGLFSGQSWNKSVDIAPSTMDAIPKELKNKCSMAHVDGGKFYIPNKNNILSDTEIPILYQHWKEQFKKTKLYTFLTNSSFEIYNTESQQLKDLFKVLHMQQIDVTYTIDDISDLNTNTTHINDKSASGIRIVHNITESEGPYAKTKIHVNNIQVYDGSVYDGYISIENLIPGPWIETLSKDLENTAEQLRLASPTSPEYRVANAIKLNNIESDLQWD